MERDVIRRHLRGAALCASLCILLAGIALASDPPLKAELDGSLIVLDEQSSTNIGGVGVAYNSVDDEFRASWYDSRISGQNNVYAQRVSAAGGLLGANTPIAEGTDSSTETAIAHDPVNNQYLITWKNQSGSPGSPGFNHRYGAIASATGGLTTTITDYSNAGFESTIAYNSTDGEFFFEARNFAGGGTSGIYGRRVATSGAGIGSQILISSVGAPAPAGQLVYNENANQYLATWRDQSASTLMGRLINADGSFVGASFQISSMFPESGLAAGAAFDPVNDQYLVVWSEFCCSGIYAQFVSAAGALVGPVLTLVDNSSGERLAPIVAYDSVNGVYLIAWGNSNTSALMVQLLYDDGTMAGDALEVPHPGSMSSPPAIAVNSSAGGFILAWPDRDYSGGNYDILGQFIAVAPDALNADAEVLSAATGGQINFALTAGAGNGNRNYLMLGGVTGTDPGTALPGGYATLPVNWDPFTDLVLNLLNSALFANFLGQLDGSGQGAAQLNSPPLPSVAIGVVMHYAYTCNNPYDFASNAVGVRIIP